MKTYIYCIAFVIIGSMLILIQSQSDRFNDNGKVSKQYIFECITEYNKIAKEVKEHW